jgi:hypothetical protein
VEVESEPVQLIIPRREPSLVFQLALAAHKLAHVIGNVEGCRGRTAVFQVNKDDLEKSKFSVTFFCNIFSGFAKI